MLFSSWLRNCKSSLDRRAELRRTRHAGAASRTTSRLFLERLEDRCLLSIQISNFNPTITEYSGISQNTAGISPNAAPDYITAGPDGNVWFTESNDYNIAQITPTGGVKELPYNVTANPAGPIITGPNPDDNYNDTALWFASGPYVMEMNPQTGITQTFSVWPANVGTLALDPKDNNVWFTEKNNNYIGYIDHTTGQVHQFCIGFEAYNLVWDANDSAFWFDSSGGSGSSTFDMIGTITTSGQAQSYSFPGHGVFRGMAIGSDGNLWVGEPGDGFVGSQGNSQIDEIVLPNQSNGLSTPQMASFFPPTPGSGPYDLAADNDGGIWFSESGASQIGRITADGIITEYPTPTFTPSGPSTLTLGPDGNIWFTESSTDKIGEVVLYNQNQQTQTQPPVTQTAIPGVSHDFNLGRFADDSGVTGPWTVTVNWGDSPTGSPPDPITFDVSSTGTVSCQAQGNQFHTYANQGVYTVCETITGPGTGDTATTQFQVVVGPVVVNTNNSGPGSLSEAIQEVNEYPSLTSNGPAHITFQIPTSDHGYHMPAASVGITSVSVSANVATLATSDPVPFTVGQTVTVAGLTDSTFDGDYQVTAVTANSFSYALVHADLASSPVTTGTASDPSYFTMYTKGLPAITKPVLLDGYSQPGASPNTHSMDGPDPSDNAVRLIVLDGSQAPAGYYPPDLLSITGAGSTIQGMVFQNASSPAIGITGSGATGNVIEGNFFDTTVGGGVFISSASKNTIGGTAASGRNIIAGSRGIFIGGDGSTPASSNSVEGNYIGIDSTGEAVTKGLGNYGVALGNGNGNIVGGGDTTPSARNVISGWANAQVAMNFATSPGAGNVVEGNYIGTDANGTIGFVCNPASSPTTGIIGISNAVISDNLISGLGTGIQYGSPETIQGNKIGTDATGTHPLPNGVGISNVSDELIGGTTPVEGNIIAYNANYGIGAGSDDQIKGNSIFNNNGPAIIAGGSGDQIEGNSIFNNTGPAVSVIETGDAIEMNSIYGNFGPAIDNLSQYGDNLLPPLVDTNVPGGPFMGTDNSAITGLTLTYNNGTLTYNEGTLTGLANTRYLVTLNATSSDGKYWGSYYIFLTTNDSGNGSGTASISNLSYQAPSGFATSQDTWAGAAQSYVAHSLGNYEQNYPVLSSVSSSASDTSISGTLNGQANTTFRVEFFSNPDEDPSGYGQGQTYLGYAKVTTDANGNVTFTTDLSVGDLAGQWISATATDLPNAVLGTPGGNTSEFSPDIQATAVPSQTYTDYLQAAVPQSSSTANTMTIYASSGVSPSTVIDAVNNLMNISQPVTIKLDLGGGTYSSGGVTASPPPNVTFVVQNGTLDPDYPALSVAGGQLVVSNCTLTTSGSTPTLLITGGRVTLSNDSISQTSTTSVEPAISVTGGTVNLGTATSPGDNTLSVSSSGDLVSNTSGNTISAVGDTFVVGGIVETAPNLSFTTLTSSAAPALLNQAVTLTVTVQANGSSGTPTGSVDFFDTTTNTDLGGVTLSGGVAKLKISSLTVGNHVIVAKYSGDANFLPSANTFTQSVQYHFSGFQPPLGNGLSFNINRTIPIQFQLTDANGNAITSLSAVTSLRIQALDENGNPVGAPFTPASTNKQGLQYTGGQYQYNWQTKGLAAGSYEIVLKLSDGTTHTLTIQLTGNGNAANAQAADSSDVSGGDSAGQLLGGNVELYVDNINGDLTPDELDRIQDAVNAVDATIAPYGVAINEVTDPTQANVTLNMGTSSAVGGYANGILGCYTTAGAITLIQGWNWYASSDPTQMGANQYDFQTTVTHELGHALGLGESSDPTSAMYSTLSPGTAIRTLTTADLNIPYDEGAADAQKAAVPASSATAGATATNSVASSQVMTAPSSTSVSNGGAPMSVTDQLFADLALLLSNAAKAYQSELSSLVTGIDALASQRLDNLLNMEAGAMGLSQDTLRLDLLFASKSSLNGA